jgi:hypothetical protein
MYLDNFGIAHENVTFIPDGTILDECYMLTVHKLTEDGYKEVHSEEFKNFPSEDQIMWQIATYKGTYASIAKAYHLVRLPFTEDE